MEVGLYDQVLPDLSSDSLITFDFVLKDLLEFLFIVMTGSGDDTAKIFDAKTGSTKRTFKGHIGSVNALVVCFESRYFKLYELFLYF